MQQGWTPPGVYRDTLRLAVGQLSHDTRKAGARPAVYRMWPPRNRSQDFGGSIESYEVAVTAVDALLLPAAHAWLTARERNPAIELYANGLHASPLGHTSPRPLLDRVMPDFQHSLGIAYAPSAPDS